MLSTRTSEEIIIGLLNFFALWLQMFHLFLFALQIHLQLKDYINIKKCKSRNKILIGNLQFVK